MELVKGWMMIVPDSANIVQTNNQSSYYVQILSCYPNLWWTSHICWWYPHRFPFDQWHDWLTGALFPILLSTPDDIIWYRNSGLTTNQMNCLAKNTHMSYPTIMLRQYPLLFPQIISQSFNFWLRHVTPKWQFSQTGNSGFPKPQTTW